jgi:hypothetical protein
MSTFLLVVAGPGLLVLGLLTLFTQLAFRARAVRGTGSVSACEERTFSRERARRSVYTLTVRFTGLDGRVSEFREERSRPAGPGTEVEIQYDPKNPAKAQIVQSPYALAAVIAVMLLIGTLSTFVLFG